MLNNNNHSDYTSSLLAILLLCYLQSWFIKQIVLTNGCTIQFSCKMSWIQCHLFMNV